MIKSVWPKNCKGWILPFFVATNMKWNEGPALGTWHRLTFPAVKSEVSELQGSIAKAVVDFHDLDQDGKISGQREEWQLASRMLFDCKYKRNVTECMVRYDEHYWWRSATAMQAFISVGWDVVRCLWWRESLNFPPPPSLIKSQILTVHRPGWGPSFDHWS